MIEAETVLYEVRDGIATVKINRPEMRNALSPAAANRLHDLWGEVDADKNVRVAILTSADCGTFCAGLDLREAARVKKEEGVDILTKMKDPFHGRQRRVAKPIIAAMTGHLIAGGIMLSLNSDLRVGLKGTQVGITETRIAGRGSPWAIPLLWMLPQPMLMEMVLTGEPIDAPTALAWGLVNRVVAHERLRAEAQVLADTLAQRPPLALRTLKMVLNRGADAPLDTALELERKAYAWLRSTHDYAEGVTAFLEKRPPRYTGR